MAKHMNRFDYDNYIEAQRNASGKTNVNKWIFFAVRNGTFKLFKAMRRNGLKILDAGCGTGYYCNKLYDLGNEVTGLDQSSNMLKRARKQRTGRRIKYRLCSLYSIPFKSESFDLVLCNSVLLTIWNHRLALKELSRVIKKNGILLLCTERSISKIELPLFIIRYTSFLLLHGYYHPLKIFKKVMMNSKNATKGVVQYKHSKSKQYNANTLVKELNKMGFSCKLYHVALSVASTKFILFSKIPLGSKLFFIKAIKNGKKHN